MDMHLLPVQIHPDLRTIVHATADYQGRDPVDVVEEALDRYLSLVPTGTEADTAWNQWDPEANKREYEKSLSRDLSVRVQDRARQDGVTYLQVIDRALRHYFNSLAA